MKLRLRHLCIAGLVLYWPVVFLLTHLSQVPTWIISTQMSDKTMHYLGYLTLVFLWWFSIFPSKRPSLLHLPFWITLAVLAAYGGLDEWLQGFTHRTPDIWDWAADMCGVLTGLAIFALVGTRNSALAVAVFVIFVLTSICRTDPLGFVPFADILFYICSYGIVTVLWMDYLRKHGITSRSAYIILSLLAPVILLVITSVVASLMRKTFAIDRVVAAFAGIAIFFIFYSLSLLFAVPSPRNGHKSA